MNKSNLDLAYEIISQSREAVNFYDLWNRIVQDQGLIDEDDSDGENISKFYTALSLDGRFITTGDNRWDLRTRHTFDDVHIDMNKVYEEEEEEIEDDIQNVEDATEKDLFDDKDDDEDDSEEDDEGMDEEE